MKQLFSQNGEIANLVNLQEDANNHSFAWLCSNNLGISHLLCAYDQAVSLHNNAYIYNKEYLTFDSSTSNIEDAVHCVS